MIKNSLRLRPGLGEKLSGIFLILTCLVAVSLSSAQTPEEIPVIPVKEVMGIEVKNGLLSVELSDAEFGKVIKEISEKANFKLDISSDVVYKKISTTFKDINIAKGIRRMLNLIKEKDFTISYTEAGLIDKLEIYGDSAGKSHAGQLPKKNLPFQKPYSPYQPPVITPPPPSYQPPAPSQPAAPFQPATPFQPALVSPTPALPQPPVPGYPPHPTYKRRTAKPIQPQPEVPANAE